MGANAAAIAAAFFAALISLGNLIHQRAKDRLGEAREGRVEQHTERARDNAAEAEKAVAYIQGFEKLVTAQQAMLGRMDDRLERLQGRVDESIRHHLDCEEDRLLLTRKTGELTREIGELSRRIPPAR